MATEQERAHNRAVMESAVASEERWHQQAVEHWKNATDGERGRTIFELMDLADAVPHNHEKKPLPRFPQPRISRRVA